MHGYFGGACTYVRCPPSVIHKTESSCAPNNTKHYSIQHNMTKAMNHRYADASSRAESCERATAFLSSWIEDSLVVPPVEAAKAAKHPQSHLPFSIPLSDSHSPSGTLRRRSTISNDDHINSLVNCLQISIKLHEHEHHDRSSNHGSRVWRNVSPTCVGAVLHKELPSRRGRGAISCSSLTTGDEMTSPSPSNHPSQSKLSRKNKKSRRHTVATECNPSAFATNDASSSKTSLPLDRLRELDGPNFDLGYTCHSTKYQVIESNPSKALNLINQLRIHDDAWVLRSSREWTYAIVADFPNEGNEASIRFVIDKLGNTKTLKMKHWAKYIRLVDAESTS